MEDERVQVEQVARLLSQAVGDERALEVVQNACRELGLRAGSGLSLSEALNVLEHIAAQPGLLGVTARFAKSRLHLSLRW